ncbi:quinone-dependent dihydroorotate dehydrogenase [Hyphomicrobium sp.]|uniref:quinone-dependent dihydroorotate dehydrogenase n=1 Tax=Hyphomicrobium sp. TaxID=82 RepID=UPI0039E3CE76
MLKNFYRLARSALFALSPEEAHEASLKALECGIYPRPLSTDDRVLAQSVFGLEFPNPVGIAAGYDKDARVPDAVLGLGCGFAEIGTITPKPQSGNPRPRVFRLIDDEALINRLGFNNGGHAAALARLEARGDRGGIVGVNIGANKDSDDRGEDYVLGLVRFNALASYFTVNISSPNTPGLRDLQAPEALDELLTRIMATRTRLISDGAPRRPIVVKIAPDITEEDIRPIVERILAHGVDGIAVSNTTLARPGLKSAAAKEAGGLSGQPLFARSTAMLARVYKETGGKIPLIGIGGIGSGKQALEKIEAGATLLQLYTGLVYEGPGLIGEIKSFLTTTLKSGGQSSLAAIRGRHADYWAKQPL